MVEIIAAACSGIFAGAAIFVSAVQHPASLQTGGTRSAELFPLVYHRAAPMQAGLAVLGSLSGLLAWFSGSGVLWLVGATLLGSVVPFTLLGMKTINERLLAPDLDPTTPEIPDLLRRWGRFHWARSVASALSFLVFLAALAA